MAIARIFARNCGIVIMDEPSSALDPITEAELYENMLDVAKDKTMILISHRLSSTKNVDRIFLMEDGEIIEEGTHNELINKSGKYAELFMMQASKYK